MSIGVRFMKDVMKRIKERRRRVHERCKKIVSERSHSRMHVNKLVCSSQGTHF